MAERCGRWGWWRSSKRVEEHRGFGIVAAAGVCCRRFDLSQEPVPLLFGEGDYGKPSDDHERRACEKRLGFDGGERLWSLEALAYFDADDGDFGISGVDTGNGASADGGALVASVVEDPFGSGLHLAQMHYSGGVGYAIPCCFLIAQKVVEGIDVGLGLEEEVGHGVYGRGEG